MLEQVVGKISCLDCTQPVFDFANGQSALPWRDGTSYPSNVPESDIAREESQNSNSIVLITIIIIGVILILLLLFIGLGYFRIHSQLKQVAAADIDVESPIAKAITLLKVMGLPVAVSFPWTCADTLL